MSDETLFSMKGREAQIIGDAFYKAFMTSYIAEVQDELAAVSQFEEEFGELEVA